MAVTVTVTATETISFVGDSDVLVVRALRLEIIGVSRIRLDTSNSIFLLV